MRAVLGLEDGTWFEGKSFTGPGETSGEVIFNTSMTGYQEVLTDPSYKQQLVCMTYPHIGNYGINPDDVESDRVQVAGFIVKECSLQPSNWRSTSSLPDYLMRQEVMGLEGIDTRALTKHIRIHGAMRACISTYELEPAKVVAKAREIPQMEGLNLVDEVTPKHPYAWTDSGPQQALLEEGKYNWPGHGPRVVVYDYGVKWNILRLLHSQGMQILAVPSGFSAEQVRRLDPDVIFLSNGPGDPAALPEVIHNVSLLLNDFPTGGICLGHQILGLVMGGNSFKLKFGHHGANHPVMDVAKNKIQISTQNHGFCVDISGIEGLQETHTNLNDRTLEGFIHTSRPIMAVQYHPEAGPGPHDSHYFFQDFADMVHKHL